MDKKEISRLGSEKIKAKRQRFIALLGGKCGCGKIAKDVYVYAKDVYETAWMPAKGLYGHPWEQMEARADDYYLSCSMCHTIKVGRAIEHGGGSQGRVGCKCDPCRLKRNEHGRMMSKKIRDDARLLRELRKEGRI
tara:strand:- start:74 stop:481 length:408 start_codon:yes stop_codon:yes gene_type:complete